jgi:hypothetical protein
MKNDKKAYGAGIMYAADKIAWCVSKHFIGVAASAVDNRSKL